MKAYQAIAEALVAEGVEVVFGLMGDGNLHLLTELVERHGVRFIAARHEANAVAMADGYARASGGPGVCSVTHGPGLTQLGTPLTAARLARSGVVVIAGDTPTGWRHHTQNIDQQSFALATAGAFQPVRATATVAEDTQLAFRHARLGRGPIVLNAPVDVQVATVPDDWAYTPSTATLAPPQRRYPDPERIAAVAERLAQSDRPVIVAGRGAARSGAKPAIRALADRIGALLATTLLANGWFRDEPWDIGIAGGFATERARALGRDADLVLAFGASLNLFTVDHGRMFPHAAIVQIDHDHERIGATTRVDDAIVGDCRATAEALLAALPHQRRPGFRTAATIARLEALRDSPPPYVDDPDGLDPRAVARIADAALPPDRVLVIGIGHYSGYPAIHVRPSDPNDLILPWQLGSVGLGLPQALGVAVARPDQLTVVFEGDGGVLMALPELETAARERIPLLVIVLDDSAYGAELHLLAAQGLPTRLAVFTNPDFVAVARSLGCQAIATTSLEALERALRTMAPLAEPTVLRAPISRRVVHDEVFRALRP